MLFDTMGGIDDRLRYTSDKQAHLLKLLGAQSQEICPFIARFFPRIIALLDLAYLSRREGGMRQKWEESDAGYVNQTQTQWDIFIPCLATAP